MGCCDSKEEEAPLEIPPAGQPKQFEITKFMTESSVELPSAFSALSTGGAVNSEMNTNDQGALGATLNAAAGRGKILAACLAKPVAPDTSGMGMMGGGTMQIKEEYIMVYEPAGGTVETGIVFAALKSQGQIGGVFNPSCKVDTEDETQAVIASYSSQGWRLAATKMLSSQTSGQTSALSGSSMDTTVMTEMVFQRLVDQPPCEVAMYQVAVEYSMKMGIGGMPKQETKVPDFEKFLNELGQEGWELSSVVMQPAAAQTNMQAGVLGSEMESKMPVHIVMHKANTDRKQFKVVKKAYTMKMPGLGSMEMKIEGDHVPMIKEYAKKGWTVKGAIQLPAEMSGAMGGQKHPFLYFFQA